MDSREAITNFLFIKDSPAIVDFAFVLGSPTYSSIEPAIELYHTGKTSWIVISGHGPQFQNGMSSEAELYKSYAIAKGVPASQILIETKATNTKENFLFVRDLIQTHFGWNNIRRVSISGKPFHMRRALMTARASWPKHINLIMLPSNHPDDPPSETWWQTESGCHFVMRELQAIGTYALAGDISIT